MSLYIWCAKRVWVEYTMRWTRHVLKMLMFNLRQIPMVQNNLSNISNDIRPRHQVLRLLARSTPTIFHPCGRQGYTVCGSPSLSPRFHRHRNPGFSISYGFNISRAQSLTQTECSCEFLTKQISGQACMRRRSAGFVQVLSRRKSTEPIADPSSAI